MERASAGLWGKLGNSWGIRVRKDDIQGESILLGGCDVFRSVMDRKAQEAMVEDLRQIVAVAPMFQPETRWGKKMSVKMTSAGRFGWVSDRRGYRYEPKHPNGSNWPAIPSSVLSIWRAHSGSLREPDCCLINYYGPTAKMGMHQDKDEADFSEPVLSISLGDEGLFRVGGLGRGGPTESLWLKSGDIVVMGGDARMNFHGIDKIRAGSSDLLADGGRLNVTLRVVT